jgi:hypothetical protein
VCLKSAVFASVRPELSRDYLCVVSQVLLLFRKETTSTSSAAFEMASNAAQLISATLGCIPCILGMYLAGLQCQHLTRSSEHTSSAAVRSVYIFPTSDEAC